MTSLSTTTTRWCLNKVTLFLCFEHTPLKIMIYNCDNHSIACYLYPGITFYHSTAIIYSIFILLSCFDPSSHVFTCALPLRQDGDCESFNPTSRLCVFILFSLILQFLLRLSLTPSAAAVWRKPLLLLSVMIYFTCCKKYRSGMHTLINLVLYLCINRSLKFYLLTL